MTDAISLNRIIALIAFCGFLVCLSAPPAGVVVGQDDLSQDATTETDATDTQATDAAENDNTDRQEKSVRKRSAVILEFHEDINPLSGAILKRRFNEAVDSGVEVIILDIYSPGGMTDVTFGLMEIILAARDVETVAYIESDAISGGALLSLACDKIVMFPNARIGDAGEIVMGEDGAWRFTEAKSRSVVAQKARDAATATGRPPTLAEKMCDKDMVVFESTHKVDGRVRYMSNKEWDSLKDPENWNKGRPVREAGSEMFFTVNGRRAVELGFAEINIDSRDELSDALNVKSPIRIVQPTWVDWLILVLNNSFVTFLLLAIGMIALVIELGAPGMGVGGLLAILCFGLFFWSRFLGGTSGWFEVTLFLVGLSFIAAEIFVIPGFGIAGISGLLLTLGSLVMASRRVLIPQSAEELTSLGYDVLTVFGAFIGFLVGLIVLANYIGQIPGLSRLTLKPQTLDGPTPVDTDSEKLLPGWQRVSVGDVGETISPLRPSGKMQFGDHMVDVVTEGDFVDPGIQVKVIGKQGARVVVRPVEA